MAYQPTRTVFLLQYRKFNSTLINIIEIITQLVDLLQYENPVIKKMSSSILDLIMVITSGFTSFLINFVVA